jgi:lipoprotein-releasing system ATP-binding protein
VSKVLEVVNLNKIYGEGVTKVEALKDISFSINKGEFVLIVGTSGSGKTTLLNIIGLLDKPTSGKVLIDGINTTKLNDNRISLFRSKKIGFIFQFSNLLADLTVFENVVLPRQIGNSTKNVRKEAYELLKTVGLEKQMDKRANKISGGQAQRTAIARGLINNPSVVLADEPTGNLDSTTAKVIVDMMKTFAKELGRTFIIVTHDRHQFGKVDKIISIKDGRLVETSDEDMKMMEVPPV